MLDLKTANLFLDAIYRFDVAALNILSKSALKENSFNAFCSDILEPVLDELGASWSSSGGVSREHFFSNWLRSILGHMVVNHVTKQPAKKIICACPQESHHEIGLLIFSVAMMGKGVGILYLGSNHPVNQLEYVLKQTNAHGVALSLHLEPSRTTHEAIINLPRKLPVPVFLGGKACRKINASFSKNGGFVLDKELRESCDFVARYLGVDAHKSI